MANTKISDLTPASGVTADDLLPIVNDPGGTPATQKATAAQMLAYIQSNLYTATRVVYVATWGNDADAGSNLNQPKLTIASAITAASALIVGGAPAVRVDVLDGGTYTETLTVPTLVHVFAPAATFVGVVSIDALASFTINTHFSPSTNALMAQHTGTNTGPAIYRCDVSDGRGVSGTVTGSHNVANIAGTGKNMFAEIGICYVAQAGQGCRDTSGGFGHIHFRAQDLYLAGNSAVGIAGNNAASTIIALIDHIIELGTPTGTIAIQATASTAVITVTCGEIIADTAYDIIAGAQLYLNCPRISGTRTGTPAGLSATISTQTLTDAASIAWNVALGAFASVTLADNRALANPTNLVAGASYALRVTQDGSGNRTLSYGSAYKWSSGVVPVLSTAANAVDILTFISDGTNLYGALQKAFA
jgi:hypothetical protein